MRNQIGDMYLKVAGVCVNLLQIGFIDFRGAVS